MTGQALDGRAAQAAAAGAPTSWPLDHDGKSGATLERISVDGQSYVVKHFDISQDWIARSTGELRSRHVRLWQSGLLDHLPDCLDHATVACTEHPSGRAELVLRDVSPWLIPAGTTSLSPGQHHQFLTHMAALHAAFWGFRDNIGLLPLANRYLVLSPWTTAGELACGGDHPIPMQLIPDGWRRLAAEAPRAGPLALELIGNPGPLLKALASTPAALLHGDWKIANLGIGPDGRTILLDWPLCGAGPPCADLAWYLAINGQELPETKEAAILTYRHALESHGIDTAGWWNAQLNLSLIGAFLQLGWDLVVDESDELGWWDERVAWAGRYLE